MRIVCSWFLAKGLPGDMGEKAPLDDPAITHGICEVRLAEVRADLARLNRPPPHFSLDRM